MKHVIWSRIGKGADGLDRDVPVERPDAWVCNR